MTPAMLEYIIYIISPFPTIFFQWYVSISVSELKGNGKSNTVLEGFNTIDSKWFQYTLSTMYKSMLPHLEGII